MNSTNSACISGAVFDPASGRVYITEAYGEEPVVHVFALQQESGATLLAALPAQPKYGENVTLTATGAGASPPNASATSGERSRSLISEEIKLLFDADIAALRRTS